MERSAAAFYKALRKEWTDSDVRIIDFSPRVVAEAFEGCIDHVLAEAEHAGVGVEIAYPNGKRMVVKIGDRVPGEPRGTTFKVFGEAVSVSSTGRTILFWGGWGGTHDVPMHCPDEGNAARRLACDVATIEEGEPEAATTPITVRPVPNKQGFFVRDMQLGTITPIVKTGDLVDGVPIEDFVYWNFSGRVNGMGEGEGDDIEEPARWRSATFGAVSGNGVPNMSPGTTRLTRRRE